MSTYARLSVLGLVAVGLLLVGGTQLAGAGGSSIERVSVTSDGSEANDGSLWPAITPDGRYVVFVSSASNLVSDDTNEVDDVFVHDRQTHTTERVSVASDGGEANRESGWWGVAISNDGRYIAFPSDASNLVPGDTNTCGGHTTPGTCPDVFVHDRLTGITERVSVSSEGNQGNNWTEWQPAISGDGRYVGFASDASNLVDGDTNGNSDIFVHDRLTGITERVNLDSEGNQANGYSGFLGLAMSADGRYVAFDSGATNLVSGDTNGQPDIFVHDRSTGVTELDSVDSAGNQANAWSDVEAISPDGRYVAFTSPASNLVANDTNSCPGEVSCWDVFIHDRQTGVTERVSVDSNGNQGNECSISPSISGDARYVAFWSVASNLVPGDTNEANDVFVHDRETGITRRISVDSAGNQGNGDSGVTRVAIGLDNRFVAFESSASNLVPGDTNGVGDIFVDPPLIDPVGGIAELADIAHTPDSSARNYMTLAGLVAAAVGALAGGAWYARRRWAR